MKQEEEQLQDTWLKTEEEEEARKREEATILALDPETQYSKLDELLTKTIILEFLLKRKWIDCSSMKFLLCVEPILYVFSFL
jgi:ATP-dependent DNA helicase